MLNYTLDANKRGVDVSKHLYGLFFEDINQSADGGMNAEMVINNSFEFEYFTYDRLQCRKPRRSAQAELLRLGHLRCGPQEDHDRWRQ